MDEYGKLSLTIDDANSLRKYERIRMKVQGESRRESEGWISSVLVWRRWGADVCGSREDISAHAISYGGGIFGDTFAEKCGDFLEI